MTIRDHKPKNGVNLDAPEYYINRELSWLEFNDRVLKEGLSSAVPLLDRLKFLSIVSGNLDEFFMIRVAGLRQKAEAGIVARDPSGLTPGEQLARISERAHRMVEEQSRGIAEALDLLPPHGLKVIRRGQLTPEQQRFLYTCFTSEIQPVLTPLAVDELDPFPTLPGGSLNIALRLGAPDDSESSDDKMAIVPVPPILSRFIALPAEFGVELATMEDVIVENVAPLFPGLRILGSAVFRLTRDADVSIDEDDTQDMIHVMEEALHARRGRNVVRLEIARPADERLRQWLAEWLHVQAADVYDVPVMLDASSLMEIATRPGFESLRDKPWPPQPPADLTGQAGPLWQTLTHKDILLLHPYESFDPVIQFLEQAAEDRNVLAIKQTLYRTSGDSPIIQALARAAENGKQVTVLVELKARFDESRNIEWAKRLEDAGCHVIYGIAGYKTHAKLLLIVRRESHGIRKYLHLSTGNYNDRTARVYSDIGLMTSNRDLTLDASAFFNLLTGYSQDVGWNQLTIAPTGLRRRFLELIEREIHASTPEMPGQIMAKVNSLQDAAICKALYKASRAGVRVRLNVRGICCLRPGIPGLSENIEVISILDRFLEHARIFYFQNGGHEELYMASADWMVRNLDRRLEVLFPVLQPTTRRRLVDLLNVYFSDNVKARRLLADGTYEPIATESPRVRAQETLYQQAVETAKVAQQMRIEFRPLTRPEA